MKSDTTADSCSNSDIFSVGIIFYFMITGKMPFEGNDIYEILKKNKSGKIDFDTPWFSKTSTSCRELLISMLQLDPDARITPEEALKHEYFSDF